MLLPSVECGLVVDRHVGPENIGTEMAESTTASIKERDDQTMT